jgi:hypothetical protein
VTLWKAELEEDWNSSPQLDVAATNGLTEMAELLLLITAWLLLLDKALRWPLKNGSGLIGG